MYQRLQLFPQNRRGRDQDRHHLVDGSGPAFGSGVFVALEEPNHLNQVSSSLGRDRGSASKE